MSWSPSPFEFIIHGMFGVSTNAQQCWGSTIIFALFLIELALFLGSSILILLVFGDEVIHVRFSLSKFHLVHALTCVPMKKCLAPEHCREVLRHPLEHFLDGCRVSGEGDSHL